MLKTQKECNESKYEEKHIGIKLIKLYFCKSSVTIINYFDGGEFENDHLFQNFRVFRTFQHFCTVSK